MNVGAMTRQVTIRTVTPGTSDGMGGTLPGTSVDVPNIWAEIEPLQGNEQIQAMQTGMQRPHRVTMRYRPGMSAALTLLYGTRTFDIKSVVDPEEKHRELVLMCDEVFA